MKVHTVQTSFVTGQLDGDARARSETPLYRNGAASLLNCEPVVTGGVKSRRGSRHIADLPASAVLTEFAFSLDQSYVVALTPGRADFFHASDGAPAGSVTGCPWSAPWHLPKLRFAQLGDVLWVVCDAFWPHELVRTGASSWIGRPLAFDGPDATPTLRYAPSAIAAQSAGTEVSSLLMGSLPQIGGDPALIGVGVRGRASPPGGTPVWHEFRVSAVTSNSLEIGVQWLGAIPDPAAGLSLQFVASKIFVLPDDGQPYPMNDPETAFNTTIVPSTSNGTVSPVLSFSSPWLQAGHLGTVLRVRDEANNRYCVATVREVLSGSAARVAWHGPALPPGAASLLWEEQAISGVRGYFRTVCVHGQRLAFGGTRDAGSTLFLSRSGRFRNFGLGEAKDADAIAVQAAGGVRSIRHLLDGPQLTIFTENGVSFVPQDRAKPLTPSTIRIERAAPHGSADARPGQFDGGTLFVLAGGAGVRDLSYSDEALNFQSDPVSLPATGFLGSVTDAAYLAASNSRPEELALFLNAAGRIVVFHSIRGQKIGAWYEWSTDGKWRAVACAGQKLWAVCERVAGRFALEQFEPLCPFDACRTWGTGLQAVPWPTLPNAMDPATIAKSPGASGDATLSVTDNGLTVSNPGTARYSERLVRAAAGAATGKFYFQARPTAYDWRWVTIGLARLDAGWDPDGFQVHPEGTVHVLTQNGVPHIHPKGGSATQLPIVLDTVSSPDPARCLEVCVDLDARKLWFRHLDAGTGAVIRNWNFPGGAGAIYSGADPVAGTGAIDLTPLAPAGVALFPYCGFGFAQASPGTVVFNFGGQPWIGSGPPVGYLPFGPPDAPPGALIHACDGDGLYLGSSSPAGTPPGGAGNGTGWRGLAFDWAIDPLPPSIDLPDGTLLQRAQRLVRTSLRLRGCRPLLGAATQYPAHAQAPTLMLRADGVWPPGAVIPPAADPAAGSWWTTRHMGWARPGQDDRALVPRIRRDAPMPVAVLAMKREISA